MEKTFVKILLLVGAFSTACQEGIQWETEVDGAGTYASPRAADLNQDGVLDIVLGAGGGEEWEASENGVLAFDGRNGSLLWKAPCRNQIVGCPIFADLNADQHPDVIIGGRSAQLMALDGRNGSVLWEYLTHDPNYDYFNDTTILNFFTPQFISDQDADGQRDLLVAYGGFLKARPFEWERPQGYLMVFSGRSGKLLAKAPMPDSKETYLSPVVWEEGGTTRVFFGTGGETIAGGFYITSLQDVMDGNIEQHRQLAMGKEKGFIAPPVLVDLTEDGMPEVVVTSFEGKAFAFEGKKLDMLWQTNLGEGLETHSQPGVGDFTGDGIPDFFINLGKGTWPDVEGAEQIILNGKNGDISPWGEIGSLQYASPIPLIQKKDSALFFLFPANLREPTAFSPESGKPQFQYRCAIYLFGANGSAKVLQAREGVNIGSTVLMDDLDGDGSWEAVFVQNNNPFDPFQFGGITVTCLPLSEFVTVWGQYMGPEGRSEYPPSVRLNQGREL